MNDEQFCTQLESTIMAIEWPNEESLVRSAEASVLDMIGILEDKLPPHIKITVDSTTVINADLPQEVEYQFTLEISSQNYGDKSGRAMLMGKDAGDGARGQGLLRIKAILLEAISFTLEELGVLFSFVHNASGQAAPLTGGLNVGILPLTFRAFGTSTYTYLGPRHFRDSTTGGTVTLSWILPTQRYFTKIYLRRSSEPIESITDGINLTLASDDATSYVDSPADGEWFYAVFAAYNDRHYTDADDYALSEPVNLYVEVVSGP